MPRLPRDRYDRFTPIRLLSRRANRLYNKVSMGDIHGGRGAVSAISPYNRRKINKAKYNVKREQRQIGQEVGRGTSRTNLLTQTPSGTASRLFQTSAAALTQIYLSGVTAEDLTVGRLSNKVFISGFAIHMQCSIKTGPANQTDPLVFNFAVVSRKNGGTPTATNFLRGEGTEAGVDLDTARSGLELATMAINANEYNVLFHKRYKLSSMNTGSTVQASSAKEMNVGPQRIWVPLNRQITYEDGDSTSHDSIWIVHWADYTDSAAAAASVANTYNLQYRAITYYRNMMGF